MRLPSRRLLVPAAPIWAGLALTCLLPSLSAEAQVPRRRIAQLDVGILGLSATVEPSSPVVPKATPAGVQIVVRGGTGELSLGDVRRFFGEDFEIQGDLTGPGLSRSIALPYTPAVPDDPNDPDDQLPVHVGALDPLILALPGLPASGEYTLANLRITSPGRPDFDVTPSRVTVKVIEQVLVTSVKTRTLTLDEIRQKGIVLDSDDYYAFEFTLGLLFESKPINFSFPVAFNRQGVPIPDLITPPPAPSREGTMVQLPTIIPVLFEMDGDDDQPERIALPKLPYGMGEVRIPSVIVIPGNIGYLKQFFSAKLYVANAAPVGSGLTVRDITGTLALPFGPDGVKGFNELTARNDDPLALPTLLREGVEIVQPETMPVRAVGPDAEPGTEDDVETLAPGDQGETEFLIRGEYEGFHTIDFDIRAELNGLVTGPVRIKGKASGAVLVRNPYFDVTFTVPGVVRDQEPFSVFVTLTNLGQVAANGLTIVLPQHQVSGALLVTPPEEMPTIESLGPGESNSFELEFVSQKTGQVVASYLRFDTEDGSKEPTGSIELSVGIGERGVPLSPDTLVLPAAVDELPPSVVRAAMRVLGQAWSIANAPSGTLPSDVRSISRNVVSQKALALAEAGLRVQFGQPLLDAVRDVAFDYWGGPSLDAGFDQLLRTTDAGRGLAAAIGAALADIAGAPDALAIEDGLAQVAVSGADFASFAVESGSAVSVALVDGAGRRTSAGPAGSSAAVPGAVLLELGDSLGTSLLGLLTSATSGPYVLELSGTPETTAAVALTLPDGNGSFVRGEFASVSFGPSGIVRLSLDASQGQIALESDSGIERQGQLVANQGPQLVSARIVGPEVLQGAGPFGFNVIAVFDRIVDAASAAVTGNYAVPKNGVQSAKRQLSGRMVSLSLDQPEGEYVPTTFSVVGGVTDPRGVGAPAAEVELKSLLIDAGAVVSGHVFQADGTPVTSGVVTYANNPDFRCGNPGLKGFAAVPLDENGYYEFRNVVRDRCGTAFATYIQDPATGGRRQNTAVVRAAGESITLDFALFGRGSVEGIVSDIHGPVAGATVVAVSETDPQIGAQAETDGAGYYRIDGITVGGIVVKAAKGMGVGTAAGRIDGTGVTAVVNITLDSDAVTVHGTVEKVENDGEPEALVGVTVVFSMGGQNLALVKTDDTGGFVFEGVPAGKFKVTTYWDRFTKSAEGTSVFGVPLPSIPITIVVPAPAELATVGGQVYMPDKTEADDVVVRIGNRGVLSADGSYEITGIPVSPYAQTVLAQSRDGRRSGSTTIIANEPIVYEPVNITLSGLGTAAFRVLDETGQPVVDQDVGLRGNCSNPCGCAWAKTDADGIARFANLSVGGFTAQAVRSTPTFVDVTSGSVRIVADGTTVMTTMQFPGTGTVKGKVSRPDGGLLSEILVTLSAYRFKNDPYNRICALERGEAGTTWAEEDGSFRFSGVNLGPVAVTARQSASDYSFLKQAGKTGALTAAGQVVTLDLDLSDPMAGVLSGTVELPDGTIAGQGVEVMVEGPLPEIKVTTLPDGTYAFAEILPAGYYTLTARDPVGGGVYRSSVALKAGEPKTFPFRLKGRGIVNVLVVEGEDVPVENAIVRLTEQQYPSRSFDQTVRPGTNGRVTFLDVYEGRFRITVSDSFARSGTVEDDMPPPGQEVTVTVKVTPTGRVTGHFLTPSTAGPEPVPVSYGTVKLTSGGRVIGQTTTLGGSGSPDPGFFAFDYVPVGPIQLEAQDPQTARIGTRSATIDHEGEPPTVVDVVAQRLGTVHGIVTLNTNPQALARVQVSSGGYRSETNTNDKGEYTLSGVPEGRVTVTASLSTAGFLAGSNSDVLEDEGGDVEIDVALREAGSVAGKIVPASQADRDTGRYPPADVTLSVGGTGGGSQTSSTMPDGTFAFSLVPTGRVSFSADVIDSIDHGSAQLDVVPGENSLEIPLRGVGRLEGMAVEPPDEGAPPDEAPRAVSGWIHFTGTSFPGNGVVVQVGSSGIFILPEVLAGEFTAKLQHGSGPLALYGSASGTVTAGQLTTIVVALQPSGEIRGKVLRSADTPEGSRPAFGAEVKIEHAKGVIKLLAQEDGTFSVKGVPFGAFAVRVFDPISTGRAYVTQLSLSEQGTCLDQDGTTQENCVDVGEIMIDQQAPVLTFVEPAEGLTRRALGGALVIEAAEADIDTTTFRVSSPTWHSGASTFTYSDGRFVGELPASGAKVGLNHLVATIEDLSGNLGRAEVSYTASGGTIRGSVLTADGDPVGAGVAVTLGSYDLVTDEEGKYLKEGLKPGSYTARATDPQTGLQTPGESDTLVDGGDLTLPPLKFRAVGSIRGVVFRAGTTQGMSDVTVTVAGQEYVTDTNGQFATGALPSNTYYLTATAPNGDSGSQTAVVGNGAPTWVEITMRGVGSVRVYVRDANLDPVANAMVNVPSEGTESTDEWGLAEFSPAFAGEITASASFGLVKTTPVPAQTLVDGGTLEFNLFLKPAAQVSGTVSSWDGDPVVGATVKLSLSIGGTATTTSVAGGAFAFSEALPLSWSTVTATTADGDRQKVDVEVKNPTPSVQIRLNGLGSVRVNVVDAQNAAVDGASVTVTHKVFDSWWSGKTSSGEGGNGTVLFPAVLAGDLTVTVSSGGTGGEQTVHVDPEGSATVTVALANVGTLTGIVRDPTVDAVPGNIVEGAEVVAYPYSGSSRSTTTGADGSYSFTNLPASTYSVKVRTSPSGWWRAIRTGVVISQGQTRTADFALVGIGTVSGTLTDGTQPATGVRVEISVPGDLGGTRVLPSVDGTYQFTEIPVDASTSFTVTASITSRKLSASGQGRVQQHGQSIPLNLTLLSNAVSVPYSLIDGNQFTWRIQPNGGSATTNTQLFEGLPSDAGLRLQLRQPGSTVAFIGRGASGLEATEEAKRELVLIQSGLQGLDVMRKVYVPASGYFVRYLEVLTNPTDQPMTVDVSVMSTLTASFGAPEILPRVSPTYLVFDDANVADFYDTNNSSGNGSQIPPVAVAFAGIQERAPEVSLSGYDLAYSWNAVEVPAHGTVALLHAWSIQPERWRAEATGARLGGLPPELLSGLSPEEAGTIWNFAVPSDLQSPLSALPPSDGAVSGRVLAGDGVTPIPYTRVRFRSLSPYYGRICQANSDNVGTFNVSASSYGLSGILPRDQFEVKALFSEGTYGALQVARATGEFAPAGARDLASVDGVRIEASTTQASHAAPLAVDGSLATAWYAGQTEAFSLGAAPSVSVAFPEAVSASRVVMRSPRPLDSLHQVWQARIELLDASGSLLWSSGSLDLSLPERDLDLTLPEPVSDVRTVKFIAEAGIGQAAIAELEVHGEGDLGPARRVIADVVFTGTGILDVKAIRQDGSSVKAGVQVSDLGSRSTSADTGLARFLVVPVGSHDVAAWINSEIEIERKQVPVVEGTNPLLTLQFPLLATASGYVRKFSGEPIGGARVYFISPDNYWYGTDSASSGDVGRYVLGDMAPKDGYTLRAKDPRTQAEVESGAFTLTGGENPARDIVFPPVGTLTVSARVPQLTDGQLSLQPHEGGVVEWRSDALGTWKSGGTTNVLGQLTIPNVPGKAVDVRVHHKLLSQAIGTGSVQLTDENQAVQVTVDVPSVSQVRGIALSRAGVVPPNLRVSLMPSGTSTIYDTGPDGTFALTALAGEYLLQTSSSFYKSGWMNSCAVVAVSAPGDGVEVQRNALVPRGTLSTAGQTDVWELDMADDGSSWIAVEGVVEGPAAAATGLVLDVYGPDGTRLKQGVSTASISSASSGRYAIVVRSSSGATGGYRLYSTSCAPAFRLPSRAVRGLVRMGGVPTPGLVVRSVATDVPLTVVTDAEGRYLLPVLTANPVTVEAVDAEGAVVARREQVEAGEDPVDLDAPARVPVTVYVTRGGNPSAAETVTVESVNAGALASDRTRERVTSAEGVVQTSMPIGHIRASVEDGLYSDEKDGTGVPIELRIDAGLRRATLSGVVRGGGAAALAPVPGATVRLIAADASVYAETVTDFQGRYRLEDIAPATYTLRALLGSATKESAVTLAGGDVTQDLILPVVVIRGRVTEMDGAGARAAIKLCQTYGSSCGTSQTDGQGVFSIALPAPEGGGWRVTATAAEGCAVTSSATISVSNGSYPRTYEANPTFTGVGTVAGVVEGGVGPYRIDVQQRDCPTQQSADGGFEIRHVSSYNGQVQLFAEDARGIPGTANVPVASGQTTTTSITIAPAGSLVLSLNEGGALRSGSVLVVAPMAERRSDYWSTKAWSSTVDLPEPDADGQSSVSVVVPAGPFWVRWANEDPQAAAEGELAPDAVVAIPLQAGSHVAAPATLSGEAGVYSVPLERGWYGEEPPSPFFPLTWANGYAKAGTSVSLRWPHEHLGADVLRRDEDGSTLTRLMAVGDGVRIQRRYFVPASGSFARTSTVVRSTDAGGGDVIAAIGTQAIAFETYGEAAIVSTSDGDADLTPSDTFVVYRMPSGAAAVFVWGSSGGDSSSNWLFEPWGSGCGDGCFWIRASVQQQVLVPADQSRILLTFYTQGDWTDEEAIARAQALVTLREPGALSGMTAEERAQISNLSVPAVGAVAGAVAREDGATPAAGASVALVRDVTYGTATTDEDGAFSIDAAIEGVYHIEAWDSDSGRPGRTGDVSVTDGALTTANVQLLPDNELASLEVIVETEMTRRPAPGVAVRVVNDDWIAWRAEKATATVTDGSARAHLSFLPPGVLTVSVPGGTSQQTVSIEAGQAATVTLFVPEAASLPYDLTGSDGVPYWAAADGQVTGPNQECLPMCAASGFLYSYWTGWSLSYPQLSEALLRTPREVVHGPHVTGAQTITRRVFVPPSGRFARVLDIVENQGRSEDYYELSQSTHLVAQDPAASWVVTTTSSDDTEIDAGDDFAVLSAPGENEVAVVMAGAEATHPSYASLYYGDMPSDTYVTASYQRSIQPGETQIWMTFYVLRPSGGAEAQAVALSTLADPEALAGLTLEERGQIVNFVLPTDRGDVRGTVKANGGAVAGAQVTLTGDAGLVAESTTDGRGSFSFTLVHPGAYTLTAVDLSSGLSASRTVEIQANDAVTADLVLISEALGTVVVQAACAKCRLPVSGVAVDAFIEGLGWDLDLSATVQDGVAVFEGVPPGNVTVSWPDDYGIPERTASLAPGALLTMPFDIVPFGSVAGKVVAGDGATVLEGTTVQVTDATSGAVLATVVAGEGGHYEALALHPTDGGLRLVASYGPPSVRLEKDVSFDSADDAEVVDVTMPLGVIRGNVSYPEDGSPVPNPEIFATAINVADPRSYYSVVSTELGEYVIFVLGGPDFVLTAQGPSGLTQQRAVTTDAVTLSASVDVVMPPSGSVTVSVTNPQGMPVTSQAALGGLTLPFDVLDWNWTTEHPFAHVPLGDHGAYGMDIYGVRGAGTVSMDTAGATAAATVALPPTVSLSVTLVDWPAEAIYVEALALDNDGPFGPFYSSSYAYPPQPLHLTVPVGRTRLWAGRWVGDVSVQGGILDVDVSATPDPVELRPSAVRWGSRALEGTAGFRHVVNCDGAVDLTDSTGSTTYGHYGAVYASGRYFDALSCFSRLDQEDRQLTLGPRTPGGVEMNRKVYVPTDGSFVRFFDTLSNPTAQPVTLRFDAEGDRFSGEATRLAVPFADTGRHYVVTDADAGPPIAYVLAGPGGSVAVQEAAFDAGSGYFWYGWSVTIPPNGTVALLHFAVPRAAGDVTGAQQAAEALVNLTDPDDALAGLTSEERAQIANFDAQ